MSILKTIKSRNISNVFERELWGRCAGRCEKCNKKLYESPDTTISMNLAQKAHICAFSPEGARGDAVGRDEETINSLENIILLCPDCHLEIDNPANIAEYSIQKIKSIKQEHEERVEQITGIEPTKKTVIVLLQSKIGSVLNYQTKADVLYAVLHNNMLPYSSNPLYIDTKMPYEDNEDGYWKSEEKNLTSFFTTYIRPLIYDDHCSSFSLFGIAPIPLLVLFGTLFSDQLNIEVFQLHRNPKTWDWLNEKSLVDYRISVPDEKKHQPVLIISTSGKVAHERVESAITGDIDFWELEAVSPMNDNIRCKEDLVKFRKAARDILEKIRAAYPNNNLVLPIFPAMGVSCAITLGLCRMPKADLPWIIYDNRNEKGFVEALPIGVN